jgi:hypothetical protein
MKVKIKLSIEEFKQLLNYLHNACNDAIIHFNEIELINLRVFLANGFKKLIDLQTCATFAPMKQKIFNFDVNQIYIVINYLHRKRDLLDSYMLAVYNTLIMQNKAFFILN